MSNTFSNEALVHRAADEFTQGNYVAALDLYRKLSNQLGEHLFRTNIRLCEKKLKKQGRRDCSQLPLKDIKVACVMDEFTFHCYEPECKLFPLTPDHAVTEMEAFNPDLLFIESAWRGKDQLWDRKIGSSSQELRAVVQWCKDRQVPTLFWNKEDPIHFETFLTTAQLFDFVFTTDIDCIARYKAALGHEHVYLLPFACQPGTHNPIELYPRKDAFCFAGAYYVRYPDRTRDLEDYVVELPKHKPLEIFDRNFGKEDVNYQFPPQYAPYIVGTLPFDEIDKAYKGYQYSINLNSIKQSQTMFARRVYELLGSNTITVSNFSRGVRLMFGDLVIASDSGKEIVDRLQRLDDEGRQKFRLAGLRKVMLEHTYEHRLAYVARKALRWRLDRDLPVMTVVALANSQDEVRQLVEAFRVQRHTRKRLLIVLTAAMADQSVDIPDDHTITTIAPGKALEARLCDLPGQGGWLAVMTAEDEYGPNYLLDLAIATRYCNAKVIGKATRYQRTEDGLRLLESGRAYQPADRLPVRSSVIRADALPQEHTLLPWLSGAPGEDWNLPGLAIDPFNYCLQGRRGGDEPSVRGRVNDLNLDTGLPLDELIRTAEGILPAGFNEMAVPNCDAVRLMDLIGPVKHPHIQIEIRQEGLQVQSNLPDGKHEYIYAKQILAVSEIPVTQTINTHLDATPGLDVQYVFQFLDAKKQKITHVIHTANRNHSAPLPPGTEFLRIGLRFLGSGASTIKALLWGHRKLDPARLLGRSDTLLLTNHYPSYDDLYRNGFVHTRVRAYLERGIHLDVFRLWPNSVTSYHEFQNIDVVTGGQQALRKLLDHGSYRSVLVHFLTPEMWEVLKNYPNLQRIAWVHGSEVQPIHRREYNYQNEQERAKAVSESERRMAFWRGLLNPLTPNLKLVFVSRYFAEEVFEDLGFRLPDEAYTIIHNPIDTDLFSYQPKPPEQRKRVLSIRPYASRKYANDLSVQAILKLSERPYFKELKFRMIGDGKLFDETLEPLRKFSNISIERRYLTHGEIAALHKDYGVCLTPTRMDAQGVSRDEAMASGLVPVTNAVAAIPEFVDESCGVLVPGEDAAGMADGIAKLYESPALFERMSQAAAQRVTRQSAANRVAALELALFAHPESLDDPARVATSPSSVVTRHPVLPGKPLNLEGTNSRPISTPPPAVAAKPIPLCTICGATTDSSPASDICPGCEARARHRQILDVLNQIGNPFDGHSVLACSANPVETQAFFSKASRVVNFDVRPLRHINRQMDIQSMPQMEDSSFDTFLAIHVLNHVADDNAALREIHRILKPGGQALITVPCRENAPTEPYANPTEHYGPDALTEFGVGTYRRYGLQDAFDLFSRYFKVSYYKALDPLTSSHGYVFALTKGIHVTLIAGARPNFMKVAPIIHAIQAAKHLSYRLVHTGQHYDQKMSDTFFTELNIPQPDANLGCGGGSQAEQTAAILVAFEKELLAHPTNLVIVVGDVTSTMACSIVAKKLHTKVAHVEAGIRSFDLSMPEEINRMVTDSLADYFFTTSEVANQNLKNAGIDESRIFFVGNVMIDTLLANISRFEKPAFFNALRLQENNYFVMTLHRPANVDEAEKLKTLVDEIVAHSHGLPVIFPIHPRTAKIFHELGISAPTLHIVEPLGYLHFNYLVQHAKAVITDSGGITEETTVMGVPCLTLRDNTERPETVTVGTNELIGTNPANIAPALNRLFAGEWKKGAIPELWDGKAAGRIVDVLGRLPN